MINLENINVAVLSFKTMSYVGIFRPSCITSIWAIRLYNFYSIIVLLYKFYFAITFVIDLLENKNKSDILIENIFFFTTAFLMASKMTYLKFHQHKIESFMNLISQKEYLPRNDEEALIHEKWQYKGRLVTQSAQKSKNSLFMYT